MPRASRASKYNPGQSISQFAIRNTAVQYSGSRGQPLIHWLATQGLRGSLDLVVQAVRSTVSSPETRDSVPISTLPRRDSETVHCCGPKECNPAKQEQRLRNEGPNMTWVASLAVATVAVHWQVSAANSQQQASCLQSESWFQGCSLRNNSGFSTG